MFMETNQIC